MRLGVAGFAIDEHHAAIGRGVVRGDGPTRDMFHLISAVIAISDRGLRGPAVFPQCLEGVARGPQWTWTRRSASPYADLGLSIFETLQSGAHAYFDSVVMLIFFLLAGRYLDFPRACRRALCGAGTGRFGSAARHSGAGRGRKHGQRCELAVGDLVLVVLAGVCLWMGLSSAGQSELDRALLTGETLPVFAGEGAFVAQAR